MRWLILISIVLSLLACDKLPTRDNIYDPYNNPINLKEVGYIGIQGSNAVAVSGNYAYVVGDSSLTIVDISNPAAPQQVGFYNLHNTFEGSDYYAFKVTISGNLAYISGGLGLFGAVLRVFDVSDNTNPEEVSHINMGYSRGITVSGRYVYITPGENDYMLTIDMINPANPIQVAGLTNGYNPPGNASGVNGLYVSGVYGYAACDWAGLRILDLSNPASPIEVGHYDLTTAMNYQIVISGNIAYITSDDGTGWGPITMHILDISNLSNIIELGTYTSDWETYYFDLVVSGNYVYLKDQGSKLHIINVSLPENPYEAGTFDDIGVGIIAVNDNLAYLPDGTGLHLIQLF
jgi:hypothetical protein